MSRRILSRRRRLCGVCCDRERVPPGRLFFLLPTKERTKENCRCFDVVRGCARGATVERSETGERTMIAPAGQSTARACLRSKLAALVVRRQVGPATWGLHAPKTPNKEVGRPTGYANAVLLFALNACGPSSVLKFGSSPEPPQGGRQRPPCQRGLSPLGDWGIPTGYALQPVPGQPPHTAKGRAAALPRPSRPQPIHATSPLPPLYPLHRREGS